MAKKKLTKICPKCQTEKSITEFNKNKKTKDGVQCYCRNCQKQRRQNNIKAINIQKKQHYRNNKKKILKHNKQYRQKNKKTIAAQKKLYRQRHKEEIIVWFKQYYQDHKKDILVYTKQYQQDHKKKIAIRKKQYQQKHKEAIAANKKRYRQTEQGKVASRKGWHKRKALKLRADYEDFNPNKILERDGYICQLCGKKTRPDYKDQYHPLYPNLDHIIPLSKGGAHTKLNTQCLCRQCNVEKNDKIIGQLRLFG